MKIHELPDSIFPDKKGLDRDIIFYYYSSEKDSFKEKAILKRNAFSLVMNGAKTMHFAEKTVHIQDNEINLLSAGNCIASVSITNDKPFESILIFFDNKVLIDFYADHADSILKLRNKNVAEEYYIEFEKDAFLRNYIQSLLLMVRSNRQISAEMKQLKMEELLLYLLENYTDKFFAFNPLKNASDTDLHIRKTIEANIYSRLSTEELAFLCNLSLSSFKRHFKRLYNCPPTEWINNQRMILAGKMLRSEKPGEVWYKLGFETHTGFTKAFKKHYGVSPKDFTNKALSSLLDA